MTVEIAAEIGGDRIDDQKFRRHWRALHNLGELLEIVLQAECFTLADDGAHDPDVIEVRAGGLEPRPDRVGGAILGAQDKGAADRRSRTMRPIRLAVL